MSLRTLTSISEASRRKSLMDDIHVKPYEITSLPPGFLIFTVDRYSLSQRIRMDPKEWAELKKKGYSGGIILEAGFTFDSLDEKLMNDLGWYRRG